MFDTILLLACGLIALAVVLIILLMTVSYLILAVDSWDTFWEKIEYIDNHNIEEL